MRKSSESLSDRSDEAHRRPCNEFDEINVRVNFSFNRIPV